MNGGEIMFFSKTEEIKGLVTEHTEAVMACFNMYEESMQGIFSNCKESELKTYSTKLGALESEADKVRHQIIRRLLEGGMIMDSRKSLMRVIEGVDDVANKTEDVIREIYIQNMVIPKSLHNSLNEINEVTKKQLTILIKVIRKVVHKYKIKDTLEMIHSIEMLESEVDVIEDKTIKELFKTDLSLAEKMQLKKIINLVGSMSDTIENISDLVEIIMMARKV